MKVTTPKDYLEKKKLKEAKKAGAKAAEEAKTNFVVEAVVGCKQDRFGESLMLVQWEGGTAKWGREAWTWEPLNEDLMEKTMGGKHWLVEKTVYIKWRPGRSGTVLGKVEKVRRTGGDYFVKYIEDHNRDHDEWLRLLEGEKEWRLEGVPYCE